MMRPSLAVVSLLLCAWHAFVAGQVPVNLLPTNLNLNAAWARLSYNTTVSSWVSQLYIVQAPVAVTVDFTDAYCPGEMVSIFVNGTFFRNSTTVPLELTSCAPNLDLPAGTIAYPDLYSRASFGLGPGTHSIALQLIQSNPDLPAGVMYMRALIPLPSRCRRG